MCQGQSEVPGPVSNARGKPGCQGQLVVPGQARVPRLLWNVGGQSGMLDKIWRARANLGCQAESEVPNAVGAAEDHGVQHHYFLQKAILNVCQV